MNNKNRLIKTLLTVGVIAVLAFISLPAVHAQSGPPPLFGDAGDVKPLGGGSNKPYIARERFVIANIDMLFDTEGKQLNKENLAEVTLNLFPDVSYTGVVTRAWKDGWGSYWSGRLKGVQGGYFYLTVVDGVFMAHVASPLGVYEVSLADGTLYKATQIDQSKFIDHDPNAKYDPPGEVIPEGSLGSNADSATRIDIMVAYTDDARAAAGGTAAMKATILMALNETNTSYANSGITTRLRLVHVQEYSYTETRDLDTDLSRLRSTNDSYFSTIHSLRNTYGADMVGLIVEDGGVNSNGSTKCGKANAIMANATNAFQVNVRSCATGYYSFGHEFGHLQGARHDTYNDPLPLPYAYGHGYVHTGTTAATRWRTVMAYNDKCSDLGYNCTRLQYWSNPAKKWLGAVMGNVWAKNYLVLNNTDYTVANFRTQKIGNDFNSTFNGSSIGWSSVNGSWLISSSQYYRTDGVPNSLASARHTSTYGDFSFEARMKRTGCDWCSNGLIIRGKSTGLNFWKMWYSSYWFGYSRDGRFGIFEYSSTGGETTLKGWTNHSAIITGDEWNTLKVVAVGSSLKFYINSTLVWSLTDPTIATGQVGVALYRDSSSTNNYLYVDSAALVNNPTADQKLNEEVVPGEEVPGGTGAEAPH